MELDAGIGVSAGTALAGNIGTEHRYEYTVIGDPVNEAARLTELAKEEDGRVLASATIVERAGEEEAGRWELGDSAELRGRSEPTRLARPRSLRPPGRRGSARRRPPPPVPPRPAAPGRPWSSSISKAAAFCSR